MKLTRAALGKLDFSSTMAIAAYAQMRIFSFLLLRLTPFIFSIPYYCAVAASGTPPATHPAAPKQVVNLPGMDSLLVSAGMLQREPYTNQARTEQGRLQDRIFQMFHGGATGTVANPK